MTVAVLRPMSALRRRLDLVSRLFQMRAQIADLRRQNKRLHMLARKDALTGLGNRLALQEALQSGLPMGLVLLDIDNLHELNARYGHPGGDACIVAVAQELVRRTRGPDLAIRLGGDEFAVLVYAATPQSDLASLAARLEQDILQAASHVLIGAPVTATACGAVIKRGESFADLYARVDALLYAQKQRRRPNAAIRT